MKETDDLIEKAKRFLRTAKLSLIDGDYDSSVSRCYYGMFFITEALLLTKNITISTHKGVLTLFGEHYIKTNIINKDWVKLLRRAYDLRQKGDYASGFIVNKKEAEEILKKANEFVNEMKKHIKLDE